MARKESKSETQYMLSDHINQPRARARQQPTDRQTDRQTDNN